MAITHTSPHKGISESKRINILFKLYFELEKELKMSKDINWDQLISSTRKSAFCAAEFSVSLYELVTALESEAKKPQEPKGDGPENPPTPT